MTSSDTPQVTLAQARAFWHHRQALGNHASQDLEALLASTGYVRALGGADVYLALRARNAGLSRAAIDKAAALRDIQVIPAVRGCMYLAPRRDVAVLLRFAHGLWLKRTERDLKKVGVPQSEIDEVSAAVAETLQQGPMTPRALRTAMPDGVVRKLGDKGKKVGMSSTLPVTLRFLEFAGRVERTHEGGRLDTERYLWRLSDQNPFEAAEVPTDRLDCLTLIARRFFEHAGPATLNDLATWSGAGKRDCKAAMARLALRPIFVDGYSEDALILEQDLDALLDTEPSTTIRFISLEDNYLTIHGSTAAITDPEDRHIPVQQWGRAGQKPLGEATHIHQRPVLIGDRLAGFWEYDPDTREVVWATFATPTADQRRAADAEAAAVARFITEEIGHGRSFSLDTDEALSKRATMVRAML